MKTLLIDFRPEFHNRILDLLWRQWTALGITGQASPSEQTVLDPEALLITSCTIARHDPRLFDAVLDWININGRYLNVHRLHRILNGYPSATAHICAAIAATVSNSERVVKWKRSAIHAKAPGQPEESLFRMADGTPLPVVHEPDPVFKSYGLLRDRYEPRETAQPFRPESTANFLLRLRAFLGVSARCEILAYLLLNKRGSPRAIARSCGYYPATITKALAEMGDSGYITSHVEGKHRHYALIQDDIWAALLRGKDRPPWIIWPRLFCALEQTWNFLHSREIADQEPLAQASDLRRIMKASIADNITSSGLNVVFGDYKQYTGESLIPFFIARMRMVLDSIERF